MLICIGDDRGGPYYTKRLKKERETQKKILARSGNAIKKVDQLSRERLISIMDRRGITEDMDRLVRERKCRPTNDVAEVSGKNDGSSDASLPLAHLTKYN